eukprot:6829193-Prymnesium_polylepis.1
MTGGRSRAATVCKGVILPEPTPRLPWGLVESTRAVPPAFVDDGVTLDRYRDTLWRRERQRREDGRYHHAVR